MIIPINKNEPHEVSEVICIKCESVGFRSDRSEHCLKTLTVPIVARDMSLRQGRI